MLSAGRDPNARVSNRLGRTRCPTRLGWYRWTEPAGCPNSTG